MPKAVTVSAEVDAELDAELERLAATRGESKAALINEALRWFVANEQDFIAAVEKGLEAARDGRVVSHDQVVVSSARLLEAGE